MIHREKVTVIGNVIRGAKGQRLQMMGDINVIHGQEVWTDGSLIYGTQTGGTQGIFPPENEVLPVGLTSGMNGPEVASVLDYDRTKTEVSRSSLCAFVSDGIHSYGATYNRTHLDSGPLQWYNLVTGEFLGVFPVEDACIDDDGNLLTIYGQTAGYAAPLTNPDIKYDCYIFYPSGKRKNSFSLYTWYSHGDFYWVSPIDIPSPWIYPDKRVEADKHWNSVRNQDGFILIRKNGKPIKKISINKYRDYAQQEVASKLPELQNAGDDSGELFNFGAMNQFYKRPDASLYSASASIVGLHINHDGSWYAFLSSEASGNAYPWFSWETHKEPAAWDDYSKYGEPVTVDKKPLKEYIKGGLAQSVKNIFEHVLGNDVLYHDVYITPPEEVMRKIYLHVHVHYSDFHILWSNGKDDVTYQDLSASLDAGTVFGRIVDAPTGAASFSVLPGTKFKGVKYCWPEDTYEPGESYYTLSLMAGGHHFYPRYVWREWYILGEESFSAFLHKNIPGNNLSYFEEFPRYHKEGQYYGAPSYVNNSDDEDRAFLRNGGVSYQNYYHHEKEASGTFPLNKGYKIYAQFYGPYPNYCRAYTISTDKGEQVLQVSGTTGRNQNLYFLNSKWWLDKVGRLKNGKWILGTGSDYNYFATVNKQGIGEYNYNSIHSIFSFEYVKNWNQVKSNIQKFFPDYPHYD